MRLDTEEVEKRGIQTENREIGKNSKRGGNELCNEDEKKIRVNRNGEKRHARKNFGV